MSREHAPGTEWAGVCQLLARYVAVIDNARYDELPTLFTPDGTLRSLITGKATPQAELGAYLRAVVATRTRPSWQAIRHHLAVPSVDFSDPDAITSACYFTAFSADGADHWGIYRDTLARSEGGWLFQNRVVEMAGADPSGWVGSGRASLS